MATGEHDRERRHVFGDDAEQYDTARPGYPGRLVEDVLGFAALPAGVPAVEVGAGTGKATLAFAARGTPLTCVEPDARMARVLRRRCTGMPHVAVEVADFETWRPDRPYGLLYCAQAWHWVDPVVRWARARTALRPGGAVALFWNHWHLEDRRLAGRLTALHARHGLDVPPYTILDPRPRPARRGPQARQWREMVADGGFADMEHRLYASAHARSPSGLIELLASFSGYRVLPAAARERLFRDVTRTVEQDGGSAGVRVTSSLFLARSRA
ncbi:class I SAM-dependent methyltransferase [Streptomyces roseoverticillatus]|uniref:class I SAM-dependent methyltransferase n=1 Tax=Streptomyces roseoverticillatus TaxID=66429 RepID=UPI001F4869AB|nr:class I SAM-dependent methyltransferase [Streptomyces roseoverticillatus]MCF3102661.1 class I SAM-dependent methyltransferase [Streptomyces roseoverticillatus]